MSESICHDCRHFRPISTGVYECRRYSGMRTDGVRECDGYEPDGATSWAQKADVNVNGVDVTNSICVNCTHCVPRLGKDGMRDYASAQCRLHRLIASIERLECDDFQHWTAPLQRRTDEIEIDASGVQNRQVGGDHYIRHGIQPWDIWAEYNLDPWEASALKYLLRRKGKRLEDLEKCRHYLDYLIERERATGASDGR